MCAKAFSCYRHLPNLSVCDQQCSPTSGSLLSLFRGNSIKAFETAAIEDGPLGSDFHVFVAMFSLILLLYNLSV